jgi:hypothetical protein
MNNIKKAFKTKSMLRRCADGGGMDDCYPTHGKMRGLRGMADGGASQDPRILGQGSAAAAGALAQQAPRNLDAAIEAQMQGNAYSGQDAANRAAVQNAVPAAQPAAADDTPKMSWWHKYLGLADGGMPDQDDRALISKRGSRLRGPFGLADGGQAMDRQFNLGSLIAKGDNALIDGVSRHVIEPLANLGGAIKTGVDRMSAGYNAERGIAPPAANPRDFSNVQAGSSSVSTNTPGQMFSGTGKFGERAFTDLHGIGDIASGVHSYTPGATNPINIIHNDNPIASPTQPNPMGLAGQFAALNKTIQGMGNNTGQGIAPAPTATPPNPNTIAGRFYHPPNTPTATANAAFDPHNVGQGGQFNTAQRTSFSNQTAGANSAALQNQANALSAINAGSRPQPNPDDTQGYASGGAVDGPGGPTDDKVGPVMLSHGEYVLPADTVKHVGKQNLDALRASTHKFVGPRRGLRGMADGGVDIDPRQMSMQFGALPEGPAPMNAAQPTVGAAFQTQGGQRVELPNPRTQPVPTMSALDEADLGRQGSLGALPQAAAGEEAAAAVSAAARAGLRGMAGGAGRVLGGAAGAGLGLYDMSQNGVNPGNMASTAGGALLAAPNLYAKIAGGALLGGGMLYDHLTSTTPGPDTTPPPGVPRGTQQDTAASEPQRAPALSTQQEDPDLAALRQGFQGLSSQQPVSQPGVYSNADSINSHYDALSKELHKLYTPKGAGNLALRLLSLEDARSHALGQDQGNMASMYGHGVQQQQIGQQARELGLRGLGELYQKNIDRQIAMRNFQLEMAKLGRGVEEEGGKDVTSKISGMNVGPDGKPDAAKNEDFRNFLEASALKNHGRSLYSMPKGQRDQFLQQQKPIYEMLQARNAAASGGLFNKGAQTGVADLPTDVSASSWNDVANHHLPLSSYLYERLPFTNPNVVHTQSGQAVPFANAATTDGAYDMQKLQAIAAGTGQDVRKYARGLRDSDFGN